MRWYFLEKKKVREGLLCLYSGEAFHHLGRNIFYAGVDFPMVKKMVPVFFPRGKFYILFPGRGS